MSRSVRRAEVLLRVVLLTVAPATAHADFYDAPFALRLFFSVDRQSNYSSTLARQASIAALDGASANPGAAAFREPSEATSTVTTSFVDAPSSGGRRVIAAPVSFRWQAPDQGTIAFAYAYTDTRDAGGNNGLTQSLRSDEWIGGYGRRFGEHASAGFTLRITSARIVSDSYSVALGNQPVRSSTSFLSPDISAGIAAEINPSVSVGIAGGYGRTHARTTVTNLAPLLVPLAPTGLLITLPPDTVIGEPDDTISNFSLRAGTGVKIADSTAIYLDAIGLRLSTQHSGSQNLARFALGVEHEAVHALTLRAGVGVDTIGRVNWSAGIGFRPTPTFEAQIAFQTNAAPEVNPEIGRTRLLAGSLGWKF